MSLDTINYVYRLLLCMYNVHSCTCTMWLIRIAFYLSHLKFIINNFVQKPVGGVAFFGSSDGPSFLTESLRSTSSHGEESPGLGKKPAKGLGSGLFDDAGEDEEDETGELFESTVRYVL